MNYDFNEQIPDGLMDRVGQRLLLHSAAKKKKRVKNTLVLMSILVLLVPASVYGFVNYNTLGWFDSIRVAHEKGKTVKLNAVFEYGGSKMIFEDAVWIDNNILMVSYKIPNGVFLGKVKYILTNENGEKIADEKGSECNYKGEGNIRFEIENDKMVGRNIFLSLLTQQKTFIKSGIDFEHRLNIGKELLTLGQAEVNQVFQTAYGPISIEDIKTYNSTTELKFRYVENREESQFVLIKDGAEYKLFPELFIKDSKDNILNSLDYSYEENTGIVTVCYNGAITDLDKPIELAIVCNDEIVNRRIPVKVDKTDNKVIEVNREIKTDVGTFRIGKVTLGAASTALEYEFIPAEGYSNICKVEPFIELDVDGEKYGYQYERSGELSGQLFYPVGIDGEKADKLKLMVWRINWYEKHKEKFELDKGKVPNSYVLKEAKVYVEKMEVKDGKTYVEIMIDRDNHKCCDVMLYAHNGENTIGTKSDGGIEFTDKRIQKKVENDFYSLDYSDLEKSVLRYSLELEGEHSHVELQTDMLKYTDLCKAEIKIN
jgi:hypothetical protein